mgnify:FL=1
MIMIVVMLDMHNIWCCQMKLSALRKLSPTLLPWLDIQHSFLLSKILPLTVHFQAFTAYVSNAAESMLLSSSAQICKFSEHGFVTLHNVPLSYC